MHKSRESIILDYFSKYPPAPSPVGDEIHYDWLVENMWNRVEQIEGERKIERQKK